jgi:hypothetical protein
MDVSVGSASLGESRFKHVVTSVPEVLRPSRSAKVLTADQHDADGLPFDELFEEGGLPGGPGPGEQGLVLAAVPVAPLGDRLARGGDGRPAIGVAPGRAAETGHRQRSHQPWEAQPQVHHAPGAGQARPAPQRQGGEEVEVVLEDGMVGHPLDRDEVINGVRVLDEEPPPIDPDAG